MRNLKAGWSRAVIVGTIVGSILILALVNLSIALADNVSYP